MHAYGLADRGAIKIDAFATVPGFIDFYIRRRVGGTVIDNQAVKLLKF
jgi:HK97 family phage major capsid protein